MLWWNAPLWVGGGGGGIHHRAFRSCGEKPPPYSSTPNQTPILSLEGEGAIHHGSIWCCGEMPPSSPTPFKPWEGGGDKWGQLTTGHSEPGVGLSDAVVKYHPTPSPIPLFKLEQGGGHSPQVILKLWTVVKCPLPPPSQSQNRSLSEGI